MTETEHLGDTNEQISQRRSKLLKLREKGNPFPNTFRRTHAAEQCLSYGSETAEVLEKQNRAVSVAGRMMTRRLMGKASFVHLQDMSGRIQLYIKQDLLPEGQYDEFQSWDLGDILGVEGVLFKTKTGELSI